jgi:tRNA(Phe) wybutosine-synthesizing methylase Tyw3
MSSNYVDQTRFETVLDILLEHFRETETRMAELEKRIKELESNNGKDGA